MELINRMTVFDGTLERSIGLYRGDLSLIPARFPVDLLIVSAFPDDYTETPTSLIGALAGQGLRVAELAADKAHDLRRNCGFWMSKPLGPRHAHMNVGRVLCFEPLTRGRAPEVVGDLFRGLFPFLDDTNDVVVAMSLLGSGDQGWESAVMFQPLLEAAFEWLSRGLAVKELMVVERSPERVARLDRQMSLFRSEKEAPRAPVSSTRGPAHPYDVFLSYASEDEAAAGQVATALRDGAGEIKIFDFRSSIDKGLSWQKEIDAAIESCRRIVAVLSPSYFASVECEEELMIARLRHKRSRGKVLFPIYWQSLERELALWIQVINYSDCRETDAGKMADSIADLARDLAPGR